MLSNPCFQHIDDIAEITGQYFNDIDMHFFGHVTVYPEGKFSFLCSGHDWPRFGWVDQNLPPAGFTIYDKVTDGVHFPSMDKGDAFGWSDEVSIESKERFGIRNPMMITRKYFDHLELFLFDLHCENVYEKYINNFDLFEQFIHYHKYKSRKLIEKSSNNLLNVDEQYLHVNAKKLPSKTEHRNALKPQRYYLRHNGSDIEVTQKEYLCLSLLAHNRTLKSIANELKISIRTVETHLNNLKRKLNTFSLEQIAMAYWNNRILRGSTSHVE